MEHWGGTSIYIPPTDQFDWSVSRACVINIAYYVSKVEYGWLLHELRRIFTSGVFCFLPSFQAFVIDFLSIRKVIIFSAIATDDHHPLRSRSIHQNAANSKTIRFRYIAQPRGVRNTYCARSRNDVRRLTSRSSGMPSKKIMESLGTFVVAESVVLRRS